MTLTTTSTVNPLSPAHLFVSSTTQGRCASLAKVDITNFVFSLIILVGLLISYIPQHIRIIARGSSYGLSPYFVLLGVTSATCTTANILVLPASAVDLGCCSSISAFACFSAILGVLQIGTQWVCFAVILLLFLIYFPKATPATSHPEADRPPTYRTAIIVVIVSMVHLAVIVILSLYFVLAASNHQQGWANFLGVLAAILSTIQYVPQIWTTYMLKGVESLSIFMMCIQTPGGLIWAATLIARLGPSGWSLWGVYLITAVMQGIVLCMGSYYEIRKWRKEKKELKSRMSINNPSQVTESEESPLLRDSR